MTEKELLETMEGHEIWSSKFEKCVGKEAFKKYWKVHWRACLARAMGSHDLDNEEAQAYREYSKIKESELKLQ